MIGFSISIILLYIPVILYSYILITAIFGMRNTRLRSYQRRYIINTTIPYFSIILPVRNEEKNIEKIITQMLSQTFSNFELIIIDDHSEDKTFLLAGKFNDDRIKLFQLTEEKKGKKNAIIAGVNVSLGKYLIFIDADVNVTEKWLEGYFLQTLNKYDFIIGIIDLKPIKNSLFHKFQRIEYLAIELVNLGFLYFKKPFLASNSNLCMKHSIIPELFTNIKEKIPTGDDVFLLHAYLKKDNNVHFNDYTESIVESNTCYNLKEFFLQRIRWASKAKFYRNKTAVFVSLAVFFVSLTLIFTLFYSFFDKVFISVFLYIFCLKFVLDYILLRTGIKNIFRNIKLSVEEFILFSLIYPFYVFIAGILSLFLPVKWKGRKW